MMDFITIISNVGFPIAMVIYFVVRFEKVLNNNTQAINHIVEKIEKCPKRKK